MKTHLLASALALSMMTSVGALPTMAGVEKQLSSIETLSLPCTYVGASNEPLTLNANFALNLYHVDLEDFGGVGFLVTEKQPRFEPAEFAMSDLGIVIAIDNVPIA